MGLNEDNQTEKETLVNGDMVLNCEVKDDTGLNDFQKLPAEDSIGIPFVGINRFRVPLNFKIPGTEEIRNHDCTTSMYVNLKEGKTGINMSRLCKILNEESATAFVSYNFLDYILNRVKLELRDYPTEKEIKNANITIDFNYALKQKSLKSENWGWQYYQCQLESNVAAGEKPRHYLTVNYEYSSTCPCSLSMSKQYEKDYAAGETTEGNGIATAHSQRSGAKCKVEISEEGIKNNFWIEDLVAVLRTALPTETQSLVKRLDEQAFAILNGENPMFVEHASKRLHRALNQSKSIKDWVVSVEHWESLHSHNAAATIYKGIENGLDHRF